MNVPPSLTVLLAAIMCSLAAFDTVRLVVSTRLGRSQKDVDLFHALMGASMAAMLLGHLSAFPMEFLAIAFGCYGCWFVSRIPWEVAGGGSAGSLHRHGVSHATAAAAMVFMLLDMPAAGLGYRSPLLATGLAGVLLVEGALHLRALTRPIGPVPQSADGAPDAPHLDHEAASTRSSGSTGTGVALLEVERVQVSWAAPSPASRGSFLLRQELSEGCQITMSVVMAVVLLVH